MCTILYKSLRRLLLTTGAAIFTVVALFFLPEARAETAEQKAPEPQKTAARAPAAQAVITVADVATRLTEVANLLHTFSTELALSAQIEAIGASLPLVSADIDRQHETSGSAIGWYTMGKERRESMLVMTHCATVLSFNDNWNK